MNEQITKILACYVSSPEGSEQQAEIEKEMKKQGLCLPNQLRYNNPSQIGKMVKVKLSAQSVNKFLEKYGYQYKDDNCQWTPTLKGNEYALIVDFEYPKVGKYMTKPHVKWRFDIILILNEIIDKELVSGGKK